MKQERTSKKEIEHKQNVQNIHKEKALKELEAHLKIEKEQHINSCLHNKDYLNQVKRKDILEKVRAELKNHSNEFTQ